MLTFWQRCEGAQALAYAEAAPFTPSPLQLEQALQPLIGDLMAMEYPQGYIRQTFAPHGLMPLAVALFKRVEYRRA